jgi:hypothetical protein
MEGKKSFILYNDMLSIVNDLTDEQAGQLIKTIVSYVNDENPLITDQLIKIAFTPIKNQLKRDLSKWNEEKENKSNGGKLGNLKKWHLDLYNQVVKQDITLEKALEIAKNRSLSHSDTMRSDSDNMRSLPIASIAVNVNDNVNVNDISTTNAKKEVVYKTYIADANEDIENFKETLKDVILKKPKSVELLMMDNKVYMDDENKNRLWIDFIKNAVKNTPQLKDEKHIYNCFKMFIQDNAVKYQTPKRKYNFE